MRPSIKALFFAPAFMLAAACNKDKPADPSLTNDLTLAAQARQNATLDSISAAERIRAATPAPALRTGSTSPARASNSSPRRRSSAERSRGTSSGNVTVSEGRTVTEKNTKRDAAIGAAAGAIIGASTSRDKVKGGLIGAAAGGIIGGVIGNNVDIKKRRVP